MFNETYSFFRIFGIAPCYYISTLTKIDRFLSKTTQLKMSKICLQGAYKSHFLSLYCTSYIQYLNKYALTCPNNGL